MKMSDHDIIERVVAEPFGDGVLHGCDKRGGVIGRSAINEAGNASGSDDQSGVALANVNKVDMQISIANAEDKRCAKKSERKKAKLFHSYTSVKILP